MTPRQAAVAFLVLLVALSVFHVLLLAGVVPAELAWGGRVDESPVNMVLMELGAMILLAVFGAIVATRAGLLPFGGDGKAVRVATWVVCGYFVFNTVGNILAHSGVERLVMTPVSVTLAMLAGVVARGRRS